VILVIIGLVLQFAPGLINWVGKLPGDIRYETEHTKIFIPITTMIIISLVLTLLINFFKG